MHLAFSSGKTAFSWQQAVSSGLHDAPESSHIGRHTFPRPRCQSADGPGIWEAKQISSPAFIRFLQALGSLETTIRPKPPKTGLGLQGQPPCGTEGKKFRSQIGKQRFRKKDFWPRSGSWFDHYDATWDVYHWFPRQSVGGGSHLQPLPQVASFRDQLKLTFSPKLQRFVEFQRMTFLKEPHTNVDSWDESYYANYYSKWVEGPDVWKQIFEGTTASLGVQYTPTASGVSASATLEIYPRRR